MYQLLLSVTLCLLAVYAKNEQLEGHALYQVNVQTLEQVEILSGIVEKYYLDVWKYAVPGREGLILVPRESRDVFQSELYEAGIKYKIDVQNIKESVDLEDKILTAAASKRSNWSHPGLPFDRIHRYSVVDDYLVELARLYPNLVRVVLGGRSFEGRDINYLKISTSNFQDNSKPVIMLMSLLHSREWVSLPATLYAIHKLVIDVTDPDMVRDVDWIILPIANPDGYEFTHTHNRFWNKNRVRGLMPFDICVGVDLNSNFDAFWGVGTSSVPCAETYHGRAPFSEYESRVVRDIVRQYRHRFELFIDMHSFGSLILYPYGTQIPPPNAPTLNMVGMKMAQKINAVKRPENRNYTVGNFGALWFRVAGGSGDYARLQNVPLAYTFELPSYRYNVSGMDSFLVDPAFIEQAGFETWEGIKEGARWVVRNTRLRDLK